MVTGSRVFLHLRRCVPGLGCADEQREHAQPGADPADPDRPDQVLPGHRRPLPAGATPGGQVRGHTQRTPKPTVPPSQGSALSPVCAAVAVACGAKAMSSPNFAK